MASPQGITELAIQAENEAKSKAAALAAAAANKVTAIAESPAIKFAFKIFCIIAPSFFGVAFLLLGIAGNKEFFAQYYDTVYWIAIPLFIYVLSTVASLASQFVTCKTFNIDIVFQSSWQILPWIFGALGISEIAAIRAPVVSLTPYKGLKGINDILEIERLRADEFIREKAVSYWVFWLVLIGQMSVIGKTTICAS